MSGELGAIQVQKCAPKSNQCDRTPQWITVNPRNKKMTNLRYAPPSFLNDLDQRVIFVEFLNAQYWIQFDPTISEATVHSNITFNSDTEGFAAVSLNQPVTSATLDDQDVELQDQDSPDKMASFKILSQSVSPGTHVLTVRSSLSEKGPYGFPITWLSHPARVDCTFNMSDRKRDGSYLEAFLPSNYCFDQFHMSFSVAVLNSSKPHSIFSNGSVSTDAPGYWKVDFPKYFNSSCPWFHLGPSDEYESLQGEFSTSHGKTVPIFIYTKASPRSHSLLNTFLKYSLNILKELESDFGAFPHPTLTIFAVEDRDFAMEYAGAAATDLTALRHELNHSFFARGILPANGDAGWIDEAIATWADHGYPRSEILRIPKVNMGSRSKYIRTTSPAAYTVGRDFISHLDYVLRERGGLIPFLETYATQKRYQPITTEEFQELIEKFYGASLKDLFDTYVYGIESTT